MWWLRHAQVTRAFEGTGVYEVKVDSALDGNQQFGLVFESAPGTFLIFMLYAHDKVWGYIERFVNIAGSQFKHTFPGSHVSGHDTGLRVPDPGPYWLRVSVTDHPSPASRTWRFQWSVDGANWTTVWNGPLEAESGDQNIGAIQRVGVFAGNQPELFSAFNARFDYFRAYPFSALPIDPPVGLTAVPGDRVVALNWGPVTGAIGYRLYRRDGAGPYVRIHEGIATAYTDTGLVNGAPYGYAVTAYDATRESSYSVDVAATPRVVAGPPAALPAGGLVLLLDAGNAALGVADGSAVTTWRDASGGGRDAVASAGRAPILVAGSLGGDAVLRFDGQDDGMDLPAGFTDFTAGLSMFVVARPTAVRAGSKLVLLGSGAGQGNVALGRNGEGAGLQYFTTDSGGNYGWFVTADALSTNVAAVYGVVQGGGAANSAVTATVSRNGVAVGSGTVWVPPVVSRTQNRIGHSYWGGDGTFAGDVAEVIVYNRALTATEQSAVTSYLLDKYGLGGAPLPPLGVPSALSATVGDGQATLGWGAVSGATGYRVYRRVGAGAYVNVYQGTATGYTDTGLANGTTYGYVVTAYDATRESAYSAEVQATPTGALLPPGALSATVGDGQATLGWGAVSGATGYRLYRRVGAGAYVNVYQGTATGYTDTGLANGTTYGYVVTAYDATRESAYSAEVQATPMVVLMPPTALPAGGLVLLLDAGNAALGVADGSAVTTWRDASGGGRDAVASAGRAPILVAGSLGGDAVLRFDGQDDGMDLPAGFTDFTAGLSMFVVARPTAVRAGSKLVLLGSGAGQGNVALGRNGEGAGLQYFTTDSGGNYGWFVTADALSTNVAAVYGVVQGGGAANSAVTATVSRNGVAVGSGTVWVPPVVSRTQNRIGHSYWGGDGTFAGDVAEVIVYNRALTATEQSAVTSYLLDKYGLGGAPLPPLGVPSALSATVGDGQATLGWGAVSGATGYRVYRRVGAGAYVNVYQGTATGYTDTGLANGTTYGYVVTAYDATRESAYSAEVQAMPMVVLMPPTALPAGGLVLLLDAGNAALGVADGSAVTTWRDASGGGRDAVASAGRAPILVAGSLGGDAVLRFDGQDDGMDLPAGFTDFTAGLSMFVVARPTAVRAGSKLVLLGSGAGQGNVSLGRNGEGAGLQYFTTDSGGNYGWFVTAAALSTNEAAVYGVVQGGGAANSAVTATVSRNGVAVGSGTVWVPPVVSRTQNRIGHSYWGSDGTFAGDVAEVIVYNRALTATEQSAVTSYLLDKYGLGDTTPPTVTTLTPANGATGVPLATQIIATFSEPIDPATIAAVELRDASSVVVPVNASYNAASNTVTLTPLAPLASSTVYTVVVRGGATDPRVKDVAGNALAQNVSASFTTLASDVTPPTVIAVSPANGSAGFVRTANVTATFSEAMDSTTINATTFVLRDATDAVVPATVSYSTSSRIATLNPTPTLNSGATYRVTIVGGGSGAKDLAGNALAVDRVWSFTAEVDSTPPSVSTKSPAAGVTGVSRTANVTATFNEPMDGATINVTTFELRDPSNAIVAGMVSYNATSRVATLNPTPTLAYSTTYTAIVRGGASDPRAKDVSGNALAADVVWTFTTEADVIAPTVSSVSPANGTTGISRTANITATFSEAMDPATISASTVELRNASNVAVPSLITYSSSTRRVTIDPAATLAGSSTYVVTIRGGSTDPTVKDAQGNPLAVDRTWSFTTRP